MKKKYVPFLFICLLMLSFVVVKVESAEPPVVAMGWFDYLSWNVRAPKEVKIGEDFSVIFNLKPQSTLDVDHIDVTVWGVIGWAGGAWDEWEDSWENTRMYSDVKYTNTASFTAVKDGDVYGRIIAVYDDAWGERHVVEAQFGITQIHAKTYQELIRDYNLLNGSYLALQERYDSLEINLNNTRTLMYTSIVTTIAFIATTVYFAIRKPKAKPELKTI